MVQGYQKVSPGQPYQGFPAHIYNAMIDVINAYKRGELTNVNTHVDTIRTSGVAYVRNDSGTTLARLAVLGIDAPMVEPATDETEWKDKLRLTGSKPSASHVPDAFCVLREPLDIGEIGLATISGVTQAWVNVADVNHEFAHCEVDNTGSLVSASIGGARILWKEDGLGAKRATIRIGPPPEVGIVQITGTACVETERNVTTCLWSGNLLEVDTSSASLCSALSTSTEVWVAELNVCDTQGANAFTKLRASEPHIAIRIGPFDNGGDERDLYLLRNSDIGKVRVNNEDTLDFLEDQYLDHVAAGTYASGDLLVESQTNDVAGDKLVRRFVDVDGYTVNQQVLTHAAGDPSPVWVDLVEITVVTDTRLYNNALEKETKTFKVIGPVTDNGWSEAFPSTECL